MKKKWNLSPIAKYLLLSGFSTLTIGFSSHVWASNYQVTNYFYSAVAAGDSNAGGAALASDASTAFSNPAGMARLTHPELVVAGSLLDEHIHFSGSNTWQTPVLPPPFNTFTQVGTAKGNVSRFLPALHVVVPLNNRWSVGFSGAPTYGLATMYDNASLLRYNATRTELKVLDFSPVVSFKINDCYSIGLGVDFAKATFIYRAMAGLPTFPPGINPTTNDALSKNTSDGWGYGGHAGILYQLNPQTRFGLAYRSRVVIDMRGKSKLSGAGFIEDGSISIDNSKTTLTLPPVSTLSAYHDFTPCIALEGSVSYTQWNQVNNGNQTFYNIATPAPTTVTLPFKYQNTWLFALGGNFRVNQQWLIRSGVQYDQTPVQDSLRLTAIPDANRVGLSAGAHYQPFKKVGFDLGYTHLFLKSAPAYAPTIVGVQTSTPHGTFRSHADIVSGQLTWDIC